MIGVLWATVPSSEPIGTGARVGSLVGERVEVVVSRDDRVLPFTRLERGGREGGKEGREEEEEEKEGRQERGKEERSRREGGRKQGREGGREGG